MSLHQVLYWGALISFLLATFGYPSRVALGWFGLALLTFTLLY